MSSSFQVVDLFAGPGGLAEGFSAFRDRSGEAPFHVTLSVEKDRAAHRTLQLRAFLRQFDEFPAEYYDCLNAGRPLPDWSETYEGEWQTACDEARLLELGTPAAAEVLDQYIADLTKRDIPTVVIGGPPCQAYSLVGRARNQSISGYVPEDDKRHFLYREYIRVLAGLRPLAFVMENVKGMLSSSVEGRRIFEKVLEDLRCAGGSADSYRLFAVAVDGRGLTTLRSARRHLDYVVRAEDFGVPQARHRVIIVGLRADVAARAGRLPIRGEGSGPMATVRHVLEGLAELRSGLSTGDSEAAWRRAVTEQMGAALRSMEAMDGDTTPLVDAARSAMARFSALPIPARSSTSAATVSPSCPDDLAAWLKDSELEVTLNHASRSHMPADLSRYFFSAIFAEVMGRSPKAREFPLGLAPDHANWDSGKFADRFRTQTWDLPSTTVTSHISKDGHYFIHPDPLQCRALTVREAARLQTFPDNYLFLGNRTEQYVQVGNAVPPYLSRHIASVLHAALEAS